MQNRYDQLPVEQLIPELVERLEHEPIIFLQAEPGAGKTTRVPLALMDQPYIDGRILLLEPRRIAARSAATQMAAYLNEPVGKRVGYSMRLDRRVSPQTRIEVITEGLLTQRLLSDPELEGVSLVIFDEFHERSLHTDIGLSLCREVAQLRDKPLKLLIMSATLDTEMLSRHLGAPPLLECSGRSFPVEIQHSPKPVRRQDLLNEVERLCLKLQTSGGDTLVFLPGRAEIRLLEERLKAKWAENPNIALLPLFSGLSDEKLQSLLKPPENGLKRYILATSIAQTSITLTGVTSVIDSGLERRPAFDIRTGVTRLKTQRISIATSTQRAGRAGRVQAGQCYRLWSLEQHAQLTAYDQPELMQTDLSDSLLHLLNWGISCRSDLDWIEPPPEKLWNAAVTTLKKLGAIDLDNERASLNALGKQMSALDSDCRIARLLLEARKNNAALLGARLAALLSEPPQLADADISRGLSLFGKEKSNLQLLAKRFERMLNSEEKASGVEAATLLLPAFSDRLAARVNQSEGLYKLPSGMRVRLDPTDHLTRYPYIICLSLGGRDDRPELRLQLGAGIEAEQIRAQLADQLDSEERFEWTDDRLSAVRLLKLGEIELKREEIRSIDPQLRARAWTARIQNGGLDLLPQWSELTPWLARYHYLQKHQQLIDELTGLPELSEAYICEQIPNWLESELTNIRSSKQLKEIKLEPLLMTLLPWQASQWLDRYAPQYYLAPSGRRLKISYDTEIPSVALKLQEMFGCTENPKTGANQPIRIDLLSPAGRPVAMTTDLSHFWSQIYPEVRKELRGRYSKHPWPDDPLTAQPSNLTNAALRAQTEGD